MEEGSEQGISHHACVGLEGVSADARDSEGSWHCN